MLPRENSAWHVARVGGGGSAAQDGVGVGVITMKQPRRGQRWPQTAPAIQLVWHGKKRGWPQTALASARRAPTTKPACAGFSHQYGIHAANVGRGGGGSRRHKAQSPARVSWASVSGVWRCPTFTQVSALSSALRRFTVLFGMGRRGTTSLWPPDINCHKLEEARLDLFSSR